MKNTFRTPLHIVPDTTELDRQLAAQGRTGFVKKELIAPNFPPALVSNDAPGHLKKAVAEINGAKMDKGFWGRVWGR